MENETIPTPVEQLVKQISKFQPDFEFLYKHEIQQAKEMEKERRQESYENGYRNGQMDAYIK
jgi:flagellar biosynthesis/type III secretory pathway protein FliH